VAFSKDEKYLCVIGNHEQPGLAILDIYTCELVAWVTSSQPTKSIGLPILNNVSWDPISPNEFVTCGRGSVWFWILDMDAARERRLQVRKGEIPADLLPSAPYSVDHMTAVTHSGATHLLYAANDKGKVSAWDTRDGSCLVSWESDTQEICKF
jgi:hypothetical protein